MRNRNSDTCNWSKEKLRKRIFWILISSLYFQGQKKRRSWTPSVQQASPTPSRRRAPRGISRAAAATRTSWRGSSPRMDGSGAAAVLTSSTGWTSRGSSSMRGRLMKTTGRWWIFTITALGERWEIRFPSSKLDLVAIFLPHGNKHSVKFVLYVKTITYSHNQVCLANVMSFLFLEMHSVKFYRITRNKNNPVAKCYPQWELNPGPLPFMRCMLLIQESTDMAT